MTPHDAQYQEEDGTWWKNEGGQWYYWYSFDWAPYVGPVNKSFENKFRWISK